jgi:hypothetical protein
VDVVKTCSSLRPGDAGYFGTDGVAAYDNVLWGDFFYVDGANNFAQGENLVRLEADRARFGAGSLTFYGRYVNGSGADGREPLPIAWASRYLHGGVFDGGTSLVVWRDGPWSHLPFPCPAAGPPQTPGYPQGQKGLLQFDEEENVTDFVNPPCPVDPCPLLGRTPFPAAAARVEVGGVDLPVPYDFGWMLMDLGKAVDGGSDPFAQAWAGQVISAQGRFSVGEEGTVLASACPPDRCPAGQQTEVGELCLLGPLAADQPARFRVRPKGCFSSSCTQIHHAGCAVERTGSELRLDSLFCLGTIGELCTPDCSGGGFTDCASGALAAGTYTARLGSLTLTFTVPSAAGACTGSPF